MEFYAENAIIDPLDKFLKLNEISQPPFAVFFKTTANLLSASPDLKKEGELLISQPIKGTSKRFSDPIKDEESKNKLASDPKERSENIMITDLVRNDLSQTAQKDLYRLQNYAVFILYASTSNDFYGYL
jgi:para-aminobenzoate synthetase component 1